MRPDGGRVDRGGAVEPDRLNDGDGPSSWDVERVLDPLSQSHARRFPGVELGLDCFSEQLDVLLVEIAYFLAIEVLVTLLLTMQSALGLM